MLNITTPGAQENPSASRQLPKVWEELRVGEEPGSGHSRGGGGLAAGEDRASSSGNSYFNWSTVVVEAMGAGRRVQNFP